MLHCTSSISSRRTQILGQQPLAFVRPPLLTLPEVGQYFDIRLEVHAPQNGSQVVPGYTTPDTDFTFTIAKEGEEPVPVTQFFDAQEAAVERWNFTWYEDLFAQAAERPSVVEVAAKAYRKLQLTEPGDYVATLTYMNGSTTTANWNVKDVPSKRRAKNVILFVGDGMTTNMITGKCPQGSQILVDRG